MIHITLSDRKESPSDDPLGRTHYGYSPNMSPSEIYRDNHGYYVLGARADRENYALFSAPDHNGERTVVLVVEIDKIDRETVPGRGVITGNILSEGHPVFDAYVGNPITGNRNPINYIDSVVGRRTCACGCGTEISLGQFVPGHDQRALHERVGQIGTVLDFLDWFDKIHNSAGETVADADSQLRHGHPQTIRRESHNLDEYVWPNGLELFLYDDGRVKLGHKDNSIAVTEVSNYTTGKAGTGRASAHIIARFAPAENTERPDSA
ncbi:hypothetical protein [Streptosporangium sp. NPDC004631]